MEGSAETQLSSDGQGQLWVHSGLSDGIEAPHYNCTGRNKYLKYRALNINLVDSVCLVLNAGMLVTFRLFGWTFLTGIYK